MEIKRNLKQKENKKMTNSNTEERKELTNGTVCEIQKSDTEIIRISLTEYKGVAYVDMRLFFKHK